MEYQQLQSSPRALNYLNLKLENVFLRLRTKERIPLSTWAINNFHLSPEYSNESGLYSYSTRPFQKEILDEIGNPQNQIVGIVGNRQWGKSLIQQIAISNEIAEDPGPIIYISESKMKAGRFSRERIDPSIRDNEFLSKIAEEVRASKSKKIDSVLMKKFNGVILDLVGANSSGDLTSASKRYAHFDEVDLWKRSGFMGDPFETARKMQETFPNRKLVVTSTPGNEGESIIWVVFEDGDQRYYYVPCPHCGTIQRLKWGGPSENFGVKWELNKPETVYYKCKNENCTERILPEPDQHYYMMINGLWQKKKPEVLNKPTFHINKLYTSIEWPKMVEEFIKANEQAKAGETSSLKTFITQSLAELWKPNYGQPKEEQLLTRVENYFNEDNPIIPGAICYITAGIDTQDSWLHVKIKGWGIGEQSWLLERILLPGNPALDYIWNELDALLLTKSYQHPLGVSLKISAAAIDTQGHHADQAYKFVKDKAHRRIYGTKGSNEHGKPIAPIKPSMNNKGGIPLYFVGTDTAKEVIFRRLQIENKEQSGPGYMHFNHYADLEYFQCLTAEKPVKKLVKGAYVTSWEPIPGRENHDLDVEVENLAALRISKANLIKIMEDLIRKSEQLKEGSLFEQPKVEPIQTNNKNWVNDWKR